MLLRSFNASGIQRFREYLAACRDRPALNAPLELLSEPEHSKAISADIEVEQRHFERRGDAAEYLNSALSSLSDHATAHDAGLWTWLTLYYFDEVCPPSNGKRTVKNDYYYIFEPENPRHFYRHLLYVAWHVGNLAKGHDRLYMHVPLSRLDGITTEVMKRLFLTRIPCIFEVFDRLYWDDTKQRSRRGIVGTSLANPGDLTRRFPARIRQLEKTYDLYSLSADQLIELLGNEFQFGD